MYVCVGVCAARVPNVLGLCNIPFVALYLFVKLSAVVERQPAASLVVILFAAQYSCFAGMATVNGLFGLWLAGEIQYNTIQVYWSWSSPSIRICRFDTM